jgi:hypothetical protein
VIQQKMRNNAPGSEICELPPIKFSKDEEEKEQESKVKVISFKCVKRDDHPIEHMDCDNGNNNNEEEFNNNNDFNAPNNMLQSDVPTIVIQEPSSDQISPSKNTKEVASPKTASNLETNSEEILKPLDESLDNLNTKLGLNNEVFTLSINRKTRIRSYYSTDGED